MIPRRTIGELMASWSPAVEPAARASANAIVADVAQHGERAVLRHAIRLGDLGPGQSPYITPEELRRQLKLLPARDRGIIERAAGRIRAFAQSQRDSLADLATPVPGGVAGHTIVPVERAGCYAPGGRYSLPSTALMTVVTARAAGVGVVWLASPRPDGRMLAAAALAGADGVLAVGGAQAIAALAYGCGPVPPADVIAGPGNRFVTAAKHALADRAGIDLLAGPSELVVLADASAQAAQIAGELLAQAEHDADARVVLVTTDAQLADAAGRELMRQLERLPTAAVARCALANGALIVAPDLDQALATCEELAPEHLLLLGRDAESVAPRVRHCGALFIGAGSSVVLGDFGAGPNHVLPTGRSSRSSGGLSVLSFLRFRTWLRIDEPALARDMYDDSAALARLEGLEGHARAVQRVR